MSEVSLVYIESSFPARATQYDSVFKLKLHIYVYIHTYIHIYMHVYLYESDRSWGYTRLRAAMWELN